MPQGWELDDTSSFASDDDIVIVVDRSDPPQPRQAALDAMALVAAQLSDESVPDDDYVEMLIEQQPPVD